MLGQLASPCSVATRDSLSKLSLSARCSRAFHTLACIFLSFKHLHSPLWLRRRLAAARHSWKQVFALLSPCTIFARVCRTEIYCAIVRKLSQPTTNRVPSNLFEWPRCEGGRFTKLIYRTSLNNKRVNCRNTTKSITLPCGRFMTTTRTTHLVENAPYGAWGA